MDAICIIMLKNKKNRDKELKTACKLTQTEQHRTIIYYSHSMQYYDTDTERKDMAFLSKQKNSTVINPNGMDLLGYDKKSMIPYLLTVQKSDAVWYRGSTIGVVVECLTAVVLNKKVYSLETRKPITQPEILKLSELFKNNTYCESDKRLIKNLFGNPVYKRFLILLDGGF